MNTLIIRYTKTIVMLGSILAVTLLLLAISNTPMIHAQRPLPITIVEDFEDAEIGVDQFDWISNPGASDAIREEGIELDVDTGTTGMWQIGDPEKTSYQVDSGSNGANALITGLQAGRSTGAFDVDGGKVSVLSPWITLPEDAPFILAFDTYLAHSSNVNSEDDYLQVSIITEDGTVAILDPTAMAMPIKAENGITQAAVWREVQYMDYGDYAGMNIRLLIEVVDGGRASIIEAGIDNIRFIIPL